MPFNKEVASANMAGFREGVKYGEEHAIDAVTSAIRAEILKHTKPIDPFDICLIIMQVQEKLLSGLDKEVSPSKLVDSKPLKRGQYTLDDLV